MVNYVKGKRCLKKEKVNKKDKISYELILGFRLINGINKNDFKNKYNLELVDQYNIKELINKKYLIDDGKNIKVSYDKIYVENSILENFVE
jgi:oxygen-independent coproporphyrinogen-3 oxidase